MVNKIDTSDLSAPQIDTSDLSSPTPTGLPSLNQPTGPQSVPGPTLEKTKAFLKNVSSTTPIPSNDILTKSIQAIPGIGNMLGAAAPIAANPTLRRVATEQGAMAAGNEMIPGVGVAVGSVAGGTLADLEDDPQLAKKAFNLFFNPATPSMGQQIISNYQKDPDGTLQFIKQEAEKAGLRFTTGVAAQLMGMGISSVTGSMANFSNQELMDSVPVPGTIPGAKEMMEARGINTDNPAKWTNNKFIQILNGMKEHGFATGTEAMEEHATDEANLQKYINTDFSTRLAGQIREIIPSSEAAKLISDPTETLGKPLQDAIEDRMYTKLDDLIATRNTPIEPPQNITVGSRSTNKITTLEGVNMNEEASQVQPRIRNIEKTDLISKEDQPDLNRVTQSTIESTPGKIEENTNVQDSQMEPTFPGSQRIGGQLVAPGVVVPTQPLNDFIDEMAPTSRTGQARSMAENITNQGRYLSFQKAQKMRADLGLLSEKATDPILQQTAKSMYGVMTDTMAQAAKGAGKDVFDAWKSADNFTHEGREIFNDNLMKNMFVLDDSLSEKVGQNIYRNPSGEKVDRLKTIFQRVEDLTSDPKNDEELQQVLAQSGDNAPKILKMIEGGQYTYKNQMNQLRKGMVNNLLERYSFTDPNSLGTKINYAGASEELNENTNSEGVNTWKKVMTPQQLGDLRNSMDSGKLAIQRNPVAVDRALLWAGRIIAGAIGGPIIGFLGGEGGFLMSESKVASTLLTDLKISPIFQKALKAFSQPTPASVKVGTDLTVRAAKEYVDNFIKTHFIQEDNQP